MKIKRKAVPQGMRFEIFARDGFACRYCGAKPPGVVLEIDHVIPVAGGGSNAPANLVTACRKCNSGKGAKLLPKNAEQDGKTNIEMTPMEVIQYCLLSKPKRAA